MRILMLGNSFTYYHDMPEILSAMLGEEVVAHTRGGAYLWEHLDPEQELGKKTLPALADEKWDYVVMQEQSSTPALRRELFLDSAKKLCDLIHQNGAKPLFYCSWAYRDGSELLASTGLTYDEMHNALHDSYFTAARENNALVADVGAQFYKIRSQVDVLDPDNLHPSAAGSVLAAATIARVIEKDRQGK